MIALHIMSVETLKIKAMGNASRFDRVIFDDNEREVLQELSIRPDFSDFENHNNTN